MPQLCAFSGVHSEHRACSCYRQRGKEPVSCTAWISSGCIGSVPKSKQCWLKIKWKLLETHLEIDSSTTRTSHISHHSKFGSRPNQISRLSGCLSCLARSLCKRSDTGDICDISHLIPVKCWKVSCHTRSLWAASHWRRQRTSTSFGLLQSKTQNDLCLNMWGYALEDMPTPWLIFHRFSFDLSSSCLCQLTCLLVLQHIQVPPTKSQHWLSYGSHMVANINKIRTAVKVYWVQNQVNCQWNKDSSIIIDPSPHLGGEHAVFSWQKASAASSNVWHSLFGFVVPLPLQRRWRASHPLRMWSQTPCSKYGRIQDISQQPQMRNAMNIYELSSNVI